MGLALAVILFIFGEGQLHDRYEEIKQFLFNALDKQMDDTIHYLSLFIDNGFDSMKVLKTINDEELKEIGIVKIGHLKKY